MKYNYTLTHTDKKLTTVKQDHNKHVQYVKKQFTLTCM